MLNNMTVDEAITRFENDADYVEKERNDIESAKYFRQLAEWLKVYKRLLEKESNGN